MSNQKKVMRWFIEDGEIKAPAYFTGETYGTTPMFTFDINKAQGYRDRSAAIAYAEEFGLNVEKLRFNERQLPPAKAV